MPTVYTDLTSLSYMLKGMLTNVIHTRFPFKLIMTGDTCGAGNAHFFSTGTPRDGYGSMTTREYQLVRANPGRWGILASSAKLLVVHIEASHYNLHIVDNTNASV